jgi:hypothetical protein
VVWFDRPWFGESLADILNFFNSAFHFKLNDQVLNRLAPKAFEFAEIFQNRRVQILCSYWTTDVSELHRELLKTGKGQPHRF